MAADVYNLMAEAWSRLGPKITADEDELRARLARRRTPMFGRPPRPFCAVIRANDLRINRENARIWPEYPRQADGVEEHEVEIDTALLKFLSSPVNIPPPGMDAEAAGVLLGMSRYGMRRMIKDGRLIARHIPLLGGKKGRPVAMVHTRGEIDPCASRTHRMGPDRLWVELRDELSVHIPDELMFPVTRVPFYRVTRGIRATVGWRWICPGCKQTVRSLFLPLDLPDFAALHGVRIPDDEEALSLRRPAVLACGTCHKIYEYSATNGQKLSTCWNHAILHLSGGLLYGGEVKRPEWMRIAPAKMRYHLERDPDHEVHEAERLKKERFMRKLDSEPVWVNGKLNPIFDGDD